MAGAWVKLNRRLRCGQLASIGPIQQHAHPHFCCAIAELLGNSARVLSWRLRITLQSLVQAAGGGTASQRPSRQVHVLRPGSAPLTSRCGWGPQSRPPTCRSSGPSLHVQQQLADELRRRHSSGTSSPCRPSIVTPCAVPATLLTRLLPTGWQGGALTPQRRQRSSPVPP